MAVAVDDRVVEIPSWWKRHNRALVFAAAALPAILYLAWINHYALNVLQGDDWSTVPFVNAAIHGQFSLGQLWSQYNETRVPLIRAVFDISGSVDHLDTRPLIFFNALLFIVAYGLLLALFRRYLGRLSPLPVLVVGLVWFSLADVQTSLWAFQVGWYLVVLSFLGCVAALWLPTSHRRLWLGVAIASAAVASLAFVQGFIVWPLGLVCILWSHPRSRQSLREAAAWVGGALITAVIYLNGFDFGRSGCFEPSQCTASTALSHPTTTVRFLLILLGNIVPGGYWEVHGTPSYARFELLGLAMLVTAAYIIVQSIRHRATEQLPLPLLLIGFGLLFDVMITLGRSGAGLEQAIESNRYLLPNLIVLTGIIVYGWARVPAKSAAGWVALGILGAFVILQVFVSTGFGLNNGRLTDQFETGGARLAVNLRSVPTSEQTCYRTNFFIPPESVVDTAAHDHLGEFDDPKIYRALGVPTLTECRKQMSLRTLRPGVHSNLPLR